MHKAELSLPNSIGTYEDALAEALKELADSCGDTSIISAIEELKEALIIASIK
jgi:hypothetical protein